MFSAIYKKTFLIEIVNMYFFAVILNNRKLSVNRGVSILNDKFAAIIQSIKYKFNIIK